MFGSSVDLSADGSMVAVGDQWNSSNGSASGHIRIFEYHGELDTWIQLGQDLNGENAGDKFGMAVTLSADGHVAAAGGWWADSENAINSSHVRVFEYAPPRN